MNALAGAFWDARNAGRRLLAASGLLEVRCPGCGLVIPRPERGRFCPACSADLARRESGYCPSCGEPFEDAASPPHPCGACLRQPPPWDRLVFHGAYEGLLAEMLKAYKFGRALGRGGELGRMLAETWLARAGEEHPPDVLAPVPLHPRRLLWRGYNQSLELARPVARRLGAPLEADLLERVRHTTPQVELARARRLTNLKGAFRADAERTRGRRVLLVDDVSTTCATLVECARTLRRAGPRGATCWCWPARGASGRTR